MVKITIKTGPTFNENSKLIEGGFERSFDNSDFSLTFSEKDEAGGVIDWLMHEFDELAFEVEMS